MHNAKKGGEFGANGEWYKGGQFVADNEDTVKEKYLKRGPRKINVEPFKWIVAERDTFAIWQLLEGNVVCTGFKKDIPVEDWYVAETTYNRDFCVELLKMYKDGKRTISIVEFANIRKRTNAGPFWIGNKIDVRDFATI